MGRLTESLPVLDTGPSPPEPRKRRAKPPLHFTGTPPPTPPKPGNRRQRSLTWEEVLGEGPGCELRPLGPGGQNESPPQDSLCLNYGPQSQRQFRQPPLDPTPPYTSLGNEEVEKMEPTGSVAAHFKSRGRSKDSPDGSTSSEPETRDISCPDYQPVPLPRLRLLTPVVDKEYSGDDSVSSEGDEEQASTAEGAFSQPVSNPGDTGDVVQDPGFETKHPNKKTKVDRVTKSAKQMIVRWKENTINKGKERKHQEVEQEPESKMQSAALHQGQHSVRLRSQMKDIDEEEDGTDEEEEEEYDEEDMETDGFCSVVCTPESPVTEKPSQAKPLTRHSSFLSSFKFDFSPISLMDEILTGEEWAPFLSPNTSPSPSPSVDQSNAAKQHDCDDDSDIIDEPERLSLNNVERNFMDPDNSVYEEVIINLSGPNKTVDNQSDDREKTVNQSNDTRVEAVSKSEMLLDYDSAEWSQLDESTDKSSDSNNAVEPVINQPLDLPSLKLHDVLDSSAQKHRIELSKKRKHRVTKLNKRFFSIGRTTIRDPDVQLINQFSPSVASAGATPRDTFPSSVFYSVPVSAELQDHVTSRGQDNLPAKGSDGHSSNSPWSKIITAFRNKPKTKPL
ncbi:hypothetical protein DPEC_G00185230 [Dallia pectoralis]|uniref:Uncharacterized protein n=1 Tax=Dallia pectoralis TaxID=75939 RepID=A0ACC2GB72_DALPE|nr:hypothetical protein DPEC_G00185230 [Dallia pectoralis]